MAKVRSRNYPQIGLPAAVERVGVIYDRERRGRVAQEAAVRHLGYSSMNGASMGVLSALKKFALLEGEGADVQVTQDAVTVLVDTPDSPDRRAAIRRLALSPVLFRELHERFPTGLPSEDALRIHLEKGGFIPNAAVSAARAYRETMTLVESEGGGYSSPESGSTDGARVAGVTGVDAVDAKGSGKVSDQVNHRRQEQEVWKAQMPGGKTARLLVDFDVSKSDWKRILTSLRLSADWYESEESPLAGPGVGGAGASEDSTAGGESGGELP